MDFLEEISISPGLDVVRAVIVDDTMRVLLVQEVDDINWKLPGGKIEPDETVFEAFKRELSEEVGVTIAHHNIKKLVKAHIPDSLHYRYIGLITIGPEELNPTDEVAQCQYFALESLPETKFQKHIQSAASLLSI